MDGERLSLEKPLLPPVYRKALLILRSGELKLTMGKKVGLKNH